MPPAYKIIGGKRYCTVCGAEMRRFKGQRGEDVYKCPRENGHAAILAEKKRGGTRRRPVRKFCQICGAQMLEFGNTGRYVCPKEKTHEAILKQAGKGGKREGAGRKPKPKENGKGV